MDQAQSGHFPSSLGSSPSPAGPLTPESTFPPPVQFCLTCGPAAKCRCGRRTLSALTRLFRSPDNSVTQTFQKEKKILNGITFIALQDFSYSLQILVRQQQQYVDSHLFSDFFTFFITVFSSSSKRSAILSQNPLLAHFHLGQHLRLGVIVTDRTVP